MTAAVETGDIERGAARYVAAIDTPRDVDAAFGYLADFRTVAVWDPGVSDARMVEGTAPGPGTAYDVRVRTGFTTTTLRYRTVQWDPPHRFVLEARSGLFHSVDTVTVEPTEAGARVVYDARLALRGAAGIANPLLRLAFGRIGDRAADGLRRALGTTGDAG